GYFPVLSDVPERIMLHVAHAAGFRRLPPSDSLLSYDRSGGKQRHVVALRTFLNVRPLDKAGQAWLSSVAQTAAHTKHVVPDIVNVMLEELVHHRYELPGFTTVERFAQDARERVEKTLYASITDALSPVMRELIDDLLVTAPGTTQSGWHTLKRDPKQPTTKEVRFYLQHVRRLQALAEQLPPINVPVPKLKQFRAMARSKDASEMAELTATTRYALAAIFIRSQYRKTLDDAADLFIRLMQRMENAAEQKLIAHQLDHSKRTDTLIGQLKDILQAYQLEGTDTQRVDAIGAVLIDDIELLVTQCEEHMAYAGKNFLPFLLAPYGTLRPLLLNCLEIMGLRSASTDSSIEKMIRVV
ncbi:MAG: DUF4158 domain-containing protein, partial [Methylococcales bacterium]